MNENHIDDLLDSPIPEADLNARKIAINSALSQFSQEVNQGNINSARRIDKQGHQPSVNSNWRAIMNFLKKPNSGRVFATVAIGFVTVAVVSQLPKETIKGNEVFTTNPELVLAESDFDDSSKVTQYKTERADVVKASKEDEFSENAAALHSAPSPVIALEEVAVTGARIQSADTSIPPLASTAEKKVKRMPSIRQSFEKKSLTFGTDYAVNELRRQFEEPSITKASRPDIGVQYTSHEENALKLVQEVPVSTFSADVDTASYSLLRNQLKKGFLPAPAAVRTEEVINYFSYNYPYPESKDAPFKASVSVLDSPWNKSKKLVHIGIKGYDIKPEKIPGSNLVFLLDVSGSMSNANKLPLVKQSIRLLLNTLKPSDTVSIVVYAGAAGVVLEPTEVKDKTKILAALQRLNAGGSTAGGAGIELAYQLAEQNFNRAATNRIILATDGDFNVGLQSTEALKTLVERKREGGVFLSILGFGRNSYQDGMMQTLAQNGNGVAAYIDNLNEAKKVLVDQASSTLFTIAKDVKFQIEFNPQTVNDYRIIGYETRQLNREDFNNDKVDAGDIGSGHTVTVIYEITPTSTNSSSIDPLRYGKDVEKPAAISNSNEYGFLKIRYKLPDQTISKLIEQPISAQQIKSKQVESPDVAFSIAAASFAQYLKGGKYIGDMSLSDIATMARRSKSNDPNGYRSEFIQLVELASVTKP